MPLPPLSLYIHFPWCIKKCPYCDFNSHTLRGGLNEQQYIDALVADLDNDLSDAADSIGRNAVQDRKLISIFMGGGTPSLFSACSFSTLLYQLRQRMEFAADIEITLEANPGMLEHDQFGAYLQAGINRLSLGVQSFDDARLNALGRIHDAESANQAIHAAKSAGFDNFNLDLIYGLPNQTTQMAIQDCARAIGHAPTHLSFYQLTIEPNTYYHRFPPLLADNDQQFAMQTALQERLESSGYRQYEVSAYSIAGRECRHNLNYWEFGDYLGIGAGAHSKLTGDDKILRSWKQKHPETYIAQVETNREYKTENTVNKNALVFEFMMNALRLKHGVSLQSFQQRTRLPAEAVRQALQAGIARNWIEASDRIIRCTAQGYLFIDEILQELLPDSEQQ